MNNIHTLRLLLQRAGKYFNLVYHLVNRFMKKLILLWAIAVSACVASVSFTGCGSPTQQKVAVTTLFGIEKTATAAYDNYLQLVIAGKIPTNDVPKVSHAFNRFQAGFTVALDSVQFNTNALAPANLIIESIDLVNLINSVKGKK